VRLGSESKELFMTMDNRTGCMIIAFLLWGAAVPGIVARHMQLLR